MSARRRKSATRLRFARKRRTTAGTTKSAEAEFERLARVLSDWCQVGEICGRADCRRARACRGPRLSCYETHDDVIFTLLNEAPCMHAFYEAIRAAEDEELAYE